MNPASAAYEPDHAQDVEAAPGARVAANQQIPSVRYQGELIHLCGEACRQVYPEDPLNLCLASRLLSGR